MKDYCSGDGSLRPVPGCHPLAIVVLVGALPNKLKRITALWKVFVVTNVSAFPNVRRAACFWVCAKTRTVNPQQPTPTLPPTQS